MRLEIKYVLLLTWLLLLLLLLLKIKYLPNVSNLVKKTYYNEKIGEIENKITTDHNHDKHITTQKFNKLTTENFSARLKQPKLASKINISNFLKETDFDSKLKNVTSNENELNELSKKVKSISKKD